MTKFLERMALGFVFGSLILALAPPAAAQQEKIPPRSDYQYRKDYAEVEKILQEANPQKKEELLMAFTKAFPESRMLPAIAIHIITPYIQAGNWQKVVVVLENFMGKVHEEEKPQLQPYLMSGYYQTKNTAKAAAVGESIYAQSKDKVLASQLTTLFLELKNFDKYLVYGETVCNEFPIQQSYPVALQMAQIYLQKQNVGKGLEYLDRVMAAYGDAVPQGVKEADWNPTRAFAFGVKGADAYAKKDYAKTIEHYSRVTKFVPKTADAWYYIGMSMWRENNQEGAIPVFAKAAVLKQPISEKAREYLEQLYKARNNDSLEGLDEVLNKAKAELGIS